jgi:hypothetical protein
MFDPDRSARPALQAPFARESSPWGLATFQEESVLKKLFLAFAAVVALGLAACGPGAGATPTLFPTEGPTLAPIETPMTTLAPSPSELPSSSTMPSSTP